MDLWNPTVERMARDKMRALQLEKLKRQLVRVYEESPYYKTKFDKAQLDPHKLGSLDAFRHYPFFDKDEERESQEESKERWRHPLGMHVTCDPKKVIRISSTSGTTGSPTFTGYTQKDREAVNETGSRCLWRMGARPGDVVMHAFVLSMWIAGTPVVDLLQNYGATVVPIGARSGLPRFAQIARDVFPRMLICTPSYAEYLIDNLPEKAGVEAKDLGIERLMVAGEPGAAIPQIRERIEQGFGGATVYDTIGATGAVFLAACSSESYEGTASTQRFRSKPGNADIGGVVRSRLLYAVPAFMIASVLYLLVGSGGDAAGGRELIAEYRHAPGLFMLLPISIVIGFAVAGHSLIQSLTYGIVSGSITGLAAGLLTTSDFVAIEDGDVTGILFEGVSGMFAVVIMIMVLMSTFGLMRHYGLMDTIVARLKTLFGRSPRTSELAMFSVAWSLNFILLGSTGRISVIAGPINDELGAMQRIHPYRRANITDAVVSTFSYFVPWHLWPLVTLSVIEPLAETYDFITTPAPSDFLLTTFYPAVIWVVMLNSPFFEE